MKFKHIPFLLLAVVTIMLATATFVEKKQGHEAALSIVFTSWWMIALWALTALTSLIVIFRQKLQHRGATLMLHLSFLLILTGALITHIWGVTGTVDLRIGQTVCIFSNTSSNTLEKLPFSLTLNDFSVKNYPGTQSPMDYVSQVIISKENHTQDTLHISMNKIGETQGYRFYQSGYDADGQGTRLSVSHDLWGISVTYAGYALLFLSMVLFLILPNEGFRRLLREKAILTIVLLCAPLSSQATAPQPLTLPDSLASKFGNLYVYYNGRICPLQTMAKDFTTKLYGKPSYNGLSAEQVLAGWMLYPTNWIEQPIIKVKPAVAEMIGISSKYASYQDFHSPEGYKLDIPLTDIHAGRRTENARAITDADEKMNILLMLFNGQLLKIYPYASPTTIHGQVEWLSQSERLPKDMPEDKWIFIKKSMDYIGELAWQKDYTTLSTVLDKIKAYQEHEAANVLPDRQVFKAEKIYNTIDCTRLLAILLTTVGLISFFVYLYYWLRRQKTNRWLHICANIILTASLLYLVFFISLRGYVSGHLPLSNGYETMQFMSLCSLVVTLLFQRRYQLVMPFGLLLGGLTQMVAMMGEANPQITPLMPVLASPLLSLHVCIIMIAYSLLAFIMFNGLTALALSLRSDRYKSFISQLTRISRLMLYPAVFCLAAGIFIGAVWANQSWGRYWGWDPKEVWALITLLVYSLGLHRQSIHWMSRPVWFHLYMVLAFLSILMTYFGVNYFLGGMHSYA